MAFVDHGWASTAAVPTAAGAATTDEINILPWGLRRWYYPNALLTTTLALALNAALIWLLCTERSKTLGAYKRVLLQNCAVDVVASVAAFASGYQYEFVGGRLVSVVSGPLARLPLAWHFAVTIVYVAPTSAACMVPAIFFYFRHQLITKGRVLSNIALASVFSATLAWATVQGILLTVAAARNHDEVGGDVCRRLLGSFAVWTTGDVTTCFVTKESDIFLRTYFTLAFINDCAFCALISYCTFATVRHLGKAGYSERMMTLQKQLNRMLACQILIPLFTTIIPVTTMAMFAAFQITVPGAGITATMAYAWLPLASPLTTIYFVTNFRRKMARLLCVRPVRAIFPHRFAVDATTSNNTAAGGGGDTTLHKSATGTII